MRESAQSPARRAVSVGTGLRQRHTGATGGVIVGVHTAQIRAPFSGSLKEQDAHHTTERGISIQCAQLMGMPLCCVHPKSLSVGSYWAQSEEQVLDRPQSQGKGCETLMQSQKMRAALLT